ncbi:MAG: aldehyde dehydrogenase family protein [Gammaproteobacteria bacterium]|nr:aldehyde dehydrogenase family protein [Gammaproteobacteria bacterium]
METAVIDGALRVLAENKQRWARLPVREKIGYLDTLRVRTNDAAADWVAAALSAKGLNPESPVAGEEWTSGPYALLGWLNAARATLSAVEQGRSPLEGIKAWARPDGQVVVRVYPTDVWERLLLNTYTADVWMDPSVTLESLPGTVATFYREPDPEGGVSLILGAGNIASIPPLDLVYKLFAEGHVGMVKTNPVNEYLVPIFERIFTPLIDEGFIRFVYGGAPEGAYLTSHDLVDDVHITGSARTHDAIVFGSGAEGAQRKAERRPLLTKPVTSELGGVSPTIVVPGPWTDADFTFQAEHLASQKLHNDGFNCIASQVLVLPSGWSGTDKLTSALRKTLAEVEERPAYYPGSDDRQNAAISHYPAAEQLGTGAARTLIVGVDPSDADAYCFNEEFFAPVYATTMLPESDPGAFLRAAVEFSNETLVGTLGANILIHPKTAKEYGPQLEAAVADLRYGTVAVNTWTGVGFLLGRAPWGAYAGATIDDVQSGIGFVHNALLLDKPQKTVVRGPFQPFPRAITQGQFHMAPRPPWFVTNKTAHIVGERLTRYAADGKIWRLPGIFAAALRG